jgi:hypothetical protein
MSSSSEKKLELAAASDFGCGAFPLFMVKYSGVSLISRPNIAFKNIKHARKD